MKKSFYRLDTTGLPRDIRMALVTDLHAQRHDSLLSALREISPDYILMAGDILESLDGSCDKINEGTFSALEGAANISTTFYSTGNH